MAKLTSAHRSLLVLAGSLIASPAPAVTVQQLGRLSLPEPDFSDGFGTYVEVSDGRVVAMESEQVALRDQPTGYAHMFDARTQQYISELRPLDETGAVIEGAEGFAAGIALDGDQAAVHTREGVFLFNSSTGDQIDFIGAADVSVGSFSTEHNSIALDDRAVVVGGLGLFVSPPSLVFDTTNGQLTHELSEPQPSILSEFGATVASSDGIAAVAAPGGAPPSVYLYDLDTGALLNDLTTDVPRLDFGDSIDMNDGVVLIGSRRNTIDTSPAAYLYDASDGFLLHRFTAEPGDSSFGKAVAVDDGIAVVSANSSEGGAVYLFDVDTGAQLARIVPPSNAVGNPLIFGSDVAIDDELIAIGAMGAHVAGKSSAGAVYLYAIVPEPASAAHMAAAGLLLLRRARRAARR